MFTRFSASVIGMAAILGALSMFPTPAHAVKSGTIVVLCGTYRVSKTYHGFLAARMASGEIDSIPWNSKTDEKTGRTVYCHANLISATALDHDSRGNVTLATVVWEVYEDWQPLKS